MELQSRPSTLEGTDLRDGRKEPRPLPGQPGDATKAGRGFRHQAISASLLARGAGPEDLRLTRREGVSELGCAAPGAPRASTALPPPIWERAQPCVQSPQAAGDGRGRSSAGRGDRALSPGPAGGDGGAAGSSLPAGAEGRSDVGPGFQVGPLQGTLAFKMFDLPLVNSDAFSMPAPCPACSAYLVGRHHCRYCSLPAASQPGGPERRPPPSQI